MIVFKLLRSLKLLRWIVKNSIFSVFLIIMVFSFSCASGSTGRGSSGKKENSPEIIETTVKGGEKVAIRGYSKDTELNSKMKLLDLEIADCYKSYTPIGKAVDTTVLFDVIIDESGLIERADFKKGDPVYEKIAGCIARDMQELTFRPGNLREINYRLVFKPLKTKKKAVGDDKRSRMILTLSEMKRFKSCYEDQLSKKPGIGGKFKIRFVVTEDGKAKNITIADNTFSEPSVPLCVVRKLSVMIFPEGENEDYVEVNFNFETANPIKRTRSMDIDI